MESETESRKIRAAEWFEELRDRICAEFEAIEQDYEGPLSDRPAGQIRAHILGSARPRMTGRTAAAA